MTITTYYFDGSDAAATNSGSGTDWSNITNSDDGDTATDATVSLGMFDSSKECVIEGTNAPSSGDSITQVRARVYGSSDDSEADTLTDITTDGDAEELASNIVSPDTEGWSDYVTLSAPSGGWSWSVLQSLESRSKATAGFGSANLTLSKIEIEVTHGAAASGTDIQINISDSWKEVDALKINISDSWKDVAGAQINIGDSWKTIF